MYGPCFSAIARDHPLRSLTRRSLGGPLPHQLADGKQVPPEAHYCFNHRFLIPMITCGISNPFGLLSHTSGQITNSLLARSPLNVLLHSVRLACIKHAASVHPEPGSNSPQIFIILSNGSYGFNSRQGLSFSSYHFSVVKVLSTERAAFYPQHVGLSRFVERQNYRCFYFNIGSSDYETLSPCL